MPLSKRKKGSPKKRASPKRKAAGVRRTPPKTKVKKLYSLQIPNYLSFGLKLVKPYRLDPLPATLQTA